VLYAVKHGEVAGFGPPKKLLTKSLIKEVYDVDCEVYPNPITGDLAIAYLPAAPHPCSEAV